MNSHNFSESLRREQSNQKRADDFYKKYFGATHIIRYNHNTEADMKIQRRDIDVSFQYKEKRINISEKFREKDFNDLYIEIYSKFPNVRGWLDKSQADFITYFFPKRMFLIDEKTLVELYKNHLSKSVPKDILSRLINQNLERNALQRFVLQIQNRSYNARIIQAYNTTDDASWYTMGIAIPFKVLYDFGIYCKEFPFD
jgi:hypothetical protein